MKLFFGRFRGLKATLILLVLAVSCLILVMYSPQPPAPAPIIVMPFPYRIPAQRIPLFERWVPMSWSWAWRLKQAVFGRARVVSFAVSVLTSANAPVEVGEPDFVSNDGIQVWVLSSSRAIKPAPGVELLSSSRITRADGMEAQLFIGNSISAAGVTANVGVEADLFSRPRPGRTDLTAIITYSESVTNGTAISGNPAGTASVSIRTNLAVAVRVQVPDGRSLFIMDGGRGLTNGNRAGVLISVERPIKK
jgi:hypothetical protein